MVPAKRRKSSLAVKKRIITVSSLPFEYRSVVNCRLHRGRTAKKETAMVERFGGLKRVLLGGALGAVVLSGIVAIVPATAQNLPADGTVGTHFDYKADQLAAPFATPASAERAKKEERPENPMLKLPPGFHATVFAGGLDNARWLAVAKNGDVFLAESMAGKITLLRDADGDGKAETKTTFADGFT